MTKRLRRPNVFMTYDKLKYTKRIIVTLFARKQYLSFVTVK